jgi:hypothetical protein
MPTHFEKGQKKENHRIFKKKQKQLYHMMLVLPAGESANFTNINSSPILSAFIPI